MRKMNRKTTVEVDPLLYLVLASAIILLPIQWVTAWLFAVCIHELCHYCVLRMCGRHVFSIELSLSGAVMESEQLSTGIEAICALAGPIGGLALLLLAKWFPRLAICGLVHSVFNLLPIFPMDGGRILRCLINLVAPEPYRINIETFIAWMIRGAIALYGIYVAIVLRLGALPLIVAVMLIVKSVKIPCKQRLQRVQ